MIGLLKAENMGRPAGAGEVQTRVPISKGGTMRGALLRIGKRIFLFYCGVVVLFMLLERQMVYPAPPKAQGPWDAAQFEIEEVTFPSADGTRLRGWFVDHPSPRAHVLFCHGNGEHLGYLASWLSGLSRDLQVAIFAFDYRGYGKSEGKPYEQGVLADAEAAQAWLARRAGLQKSEIVLYGRSLGGGVVVYLAGKHGARALIAERTFHSLVDIGARLFWWAPVRTLMRNRYPSRERIASYHGPLLQMHGSDDEIVPLVSARQLFAACPSDNKTFLEIPGLGHNDPDPGPFREACRNLITELPDLERSNAPQAN